MVVAVGKKHGVFNSVCASSTDVKSYNLCDFTGFYVVLLNSLFYTLQNGLYKGQEGGRSRLCILEMHSRRVAYFKYISYNV